MYKYIISALLLMAVVACNPAKKGDKAAELAKLKKERAALDDKISALEKDLDTGKPANIVTVGIKNPSLGMFQHYIEVQGRVESDKNVLVTPKVPGAMVTEVHVKAGDRVSQGQVLGQLDAGVMAQTIEEVKGQLELARTVYEKQKNLWSQKIGSEIQYLQAKNNYTSLQNRLNTLEQQLSMYTLRAPFSGTVDDVNLKVGEIPTPGMSGVRVVSTDNVKITAEVSEAYIAKIHKGDHVLVYFPDLGRDMTTKVRNTSSVVNAVNRTFTIELEPEGNKADLHPNMITVVKVNDYTNHKVITLPLNVVQSDENGSYVYVVRTEGSQNIAQKKAVKTGQMYGGLVEILSGLDTSDKVIVTGYQNVVEGQSVAI